MTDEASGDLGTLQVGVTGTATELEAVLDRVEERLKAIAGTEWKATVTAADGGAGTAAPAGRTPAQQRADKKRADLLTHKQTLEAQLAQVKGYIASEKQLRTNAQTTNRRHAKTGEAPVLVPAINPDLRKAQAKVEADLAKINSQVDVEVNAKVKVAKGTKPIDVDGNLKFNAGSARKQIETDLAEPFDLKLNIPEIDLKINIESLRDQVVAAFQGLEINLANTRFTGAAQGSAAGETPASSGQAPARAQRQFSSDLREKVAKNEGLDNSIQALYQTLQGIQPSSFTRDMGDKDSLGKLEEIADNFGVSSNKLVEFVDAAGNKMQGKKGRAEGPLGTKALEARGMSPEEAKQVATQARAVTELSATGAVLSDFVSEMQSQPRQQQASRAAAAADVENDPEKLAAWREEYKKAQAGGAPYMGADAPSQAELYGTPEEMHREAERAAAARSQVDETPRSASVEKPARVSRSEFVAHVKKLIEDAGGDLSQGLPKARDIAIPAKLAKKGDTPIESLQAVKTGAGQSQGLQGDLGAVGDVLAAAKRGEFMNQAYEVDERNKRTGNIIKYNPLPGPNGEATEGSKIASRGWGELGGVSVQRANPSELLKETLQDLFPGIEAKSNPTDPMSSVLERIMAGPAPIALNAAKGLSIPGGRDAKPLSPEDQALTDAGFDTTDKAYGSSDRGAGSYAPGSANSLRNSYMDFGKIMDDLRKQAREALFASGKPFDVEDVDAVVGEEAGRRNRLAAEDQKNQGSLNRQRTQGKNVVQVTGAEQGARITGDEFLDLADIQGKIKSGDKPGAERDRGGRRAIEVGYLDLFEKIATMSGVGPDGTPESMRSMIQEDGTFSQSGIRRMMKEVDRQMYDRLGLKDRARTTKAFDKPENIYIGAERKALLSSIYERQRMATEDLNRSEGGRGTGFQPKNELSGRRTGTSTAGGAAQMERRFAVPMTELDIKRQQLEAILYEDQEARYGPGGMRDVEQKERKSLARKEAERLRAAEKRKVERRKHAPGEVRGEVRDVEAFMYVPPTRGARDRDTQSNRTINPAMRERLETRTPEGQRVRQIRDTQTAADRFLQSIAHIGSKLEKDAQGVDRYVGGPDINAQRAAAQKADFINLPAGVDPTEVRQQVMQTLEFRAAGAAGTPDVRQTKDPRTPDETREAFNKYGGITPPGSEAPVGQAPFVGYNRDLRDRYAAGGGGVGIGDRGRFQPGGAPIEVIVVGRFPLPVEVVGPASAGQGGGEPRGKAAKNTGRIDEAETQGTKTEREKRRKRLADRSIGTTVDPGMIYTYDPEEDDRKERVAQVRDLRARDARRTPQPTAAEAGFLQALEGTSRSSGRAAADAEARATEAAARRTEAENRRQRRQARVNDPVGFAGEQDREDKLQRTLRGQLRTLNRAIPRRGFGASLTDLISSLAPGSGSLERQLEAGDLATREAQEINRTGTLRAQTRTSRRALSGQIRAERAIGAAAPTQEGRDASSQREANLTSLYREQIVAGKQHNAIIRESTKRFGEFHAEATKGTTVLKSFSAAAAGGTVAGALGVLQFGLGSALTGPIIAAVTAGMEAVGQQTDRIGGFAGTAARVAGSGAEQVLAGIPVNRVTATREAQIGLSAATIEQFTPVIDERTETEAGNKQLQARIDELNTFIKTRQEGFNRDGDRGLTESIGGFFGAGGTTPTAEMISTQFDTLQTGRQRRVGRQQLNEDVSLLSMATPGTEGALMDRIDQQLSGLAASEANIKFFNEALKKGGEGLIQFSTDTESVSAVDRAKQEQALRGINAPGLADKVRDERVVLTEGGKAVTDPARIIDALQAVNNPKPEAAALLAAQKDSLKAQVQTRELMSDIVLNTMLPAQRGIASAAEGNLLLGNRPDQGFTVENKRAFDEANARARANRDTATDFVRNGPASLRVPGAGLGEAKAQQFATALGNANKYSNEIAQIQLGQETKQAALAASQYSYSIGIAKRSLQDARALVGDIKGDTQNLGAIERENFQLQRQSQGLNLAQSQRQINFNRAIAGFTAPGLTGEERAARIKQAKIEADFAQKQLDIQTKLFALAGRAFKVQGRRQVGDLEGNIGLLEEGREIQISTVQAEKAIVALVKKRDTELATVNQIFSEAQSKTDAILTLSGELAAATGEDMGKLANDVIQAYAKVYRGLIDTVSDSITPEGAEERLSYQGTHGAGRNALGAVGMANGATAFGANGVMGEAGGEAYAILRDPQKLNMTPFAGGSGGQQVTQIIVQGNTFSTKEDEEAMLRKIVAAVEQAQGRNMALRGLRPS